MKAASNFPVARPSASCGECLLEIVTSIFGSSSRRKKPAAGAYGNHVVNGDGLAEPLQLGLHQRMTPVRLAALVATSPLAVVEIRPQKPLKQFVPTLRWRGVDSNFRFRDALSSPTARPWSRRLIRR